MVYVCNFILGRVCVCLCVLGIPGIPQVGGPDGIFSNSTTRSPGFCSDAASHAHGKVAWVQFMIVHGIFQPKKSMSHFLGDWRACFFKQGI